MKNFLFLCLFFLMMTAGCALSPDSKVSCPESGKKTIPKPYRVGSTWYYPIEEANGFRQQGIASWYGKQFHGKRTSSGEIYNMYDMTAAHKTLPLGTYVRVQNLENKRIVDVKINDRGPFVRKRIIDLSYAAAKQIAIVGPGTGPVEIMVLKAPALSVEGNSYPVDYYSGDFTIQVGAFKNRKNAENLKRELESEYSDVSISSYFNGHETFFRVRAGHYTDLEKVLEFEQIFMKKGFHDAFAVAK